MPDEQSGGWYGLLAILQEGREMVEAARNAPPQAGPVCGEPLRTGPDGQLFCPYDFCVGRGWS